MKILIITTYYPPDTAIASVRPSMLAKNLQKIGHEVTVLRSGLLQKNPDQSFSGHGEIRVITYLGENSPAAVFERNGEIDCSISESSESRIKSLPEVLRKPIAKIYHAIMAPLDLWHWLQRFKQHRFGAMKQVIDAMAQERFDIVFSTYGDLETIYGGEYAAKVFGCKWIVDFRDPMEPHAPNLLGLLLVKKEQRRAVQKADACTAISDDLALHLSRQVGGKKVYTLYNGYEPLTESCGVTPPPANLLSFCYTGQLYGGKRDFSPMLKALCKLANEEKISLNNIRIHYAGKDFDYLYRQAEEYGVTETLEDHGYVSRQEAAEMQSGSDIYVVLSWNTRKEKGVLTGKFYEGIRAKKPILSLVAGEVPYSELHLLCEKYQYGFCYECCRDKEQFEQLCDFLYEAYTQKMTVGQVDYHPEPGLSTDFRYDNLARRLLDLCEKLVNKTP